MTLKEKISILTSSSNGVYNFLWKDEAHLYEVIDFLIISFSDTDELITNAKSVVYTILNDYRDRTKIYDGIDYDVESFTNMKIDNELMKLLLKGVGNIVEEENSKKGNFSLALNEDEIYQVFSLSESRKSKLDDLV